MDTCIHIQLIILYIRSLIFFSYLRKDLSHQSILLNECKYILPFMSVLSFCCPFTIWWIFMLIIPCVVKIIIPTALGTLQVILDGMFLKVELAG
jgi:Na+/alanine symporter